MLMGSGMPRELDSSAAHWHGSKRNSPLASSQPGVAGSTGGWLTKQNLDVTPFAVTCSTG